MPAALRASVGVFCWLWAKRTSSGDARSPGSECLDCQRGLLWQSHGRRFSGVVKCDGRLDAKNHRSHPRDESSTNQSGTNLKSSREYSTIVVHSESENGRFADASAWQNRPQFTMENEMQVPAQQPRFVLAWIEQRLRLTALVFATRLVRLRQVAARTAQRQVAHDGLAALCLGHNVFDVEGPFDGCLGNDTTHFDYTTAQFNVTTCVSLSQVGLGRTSSFGKAMDDDFPASVSRNGLDNAKNRRDKFLFRLA